MSIKLKPHNEETYRKIIENFKTSDKVAVVHPTGTGKSFLALKLLEENRDKRTLYIAPSRPILHNIQKNIKASGMTFGEFQNLERITYQKLMTLSEKEISELGADIIILDEFHHCGAPEWGKGIERLLEYNPGAQVLGLSATPIRYFDKSRDMAEELFGENIASQMSLEEAINTGILPRAKYVSALYEFEEELGKMKDEIEKIRDPEKKKQAQAIFERLSKKIDENTQNLPSLLSEHMKAKDGKYIVFCKNIEDMKDKIEQAQNMFGEVNPNIKTYAVSSKSTEIDNNRTLKKFEKDNDEDTLKLMFAVDMLNEGYHINDLDGIIMMRPTYSPTIYAQQLGRALTVKDEDGSEPLVIDLVNNFDSIKIIEDLCERLKEYKATGQHQSEQNTQNGLIIYDKTKEFREIARKISDLSKRNVVTLQDKIDIFQKYFEEGNEEITGQTIFEGYPIGNWAIQMRSQYNRKDESFNPSEEQLEVLFKLGILERRNGKIDEKIEALVEWYQNHPDIKVERIVKDKPISAETIEKLRELAQTQGINFSEIEEKYRKIQRYNEYVRQRECKGKLTPDQIMKCKEGGLGGRFGFPTKIEELAQKYHLEKEKVSELCAKFGNIDNFLKMYREGELSRQEIIEYNGTLINNQIDTEGNPNSEGYLELISWLLYRSREKIQLSGISFYSSKKIDEWLKNVLTPNQESEIRKKFGLDDGKYKHFRKDGKETVSDKQWKIILELRGLFDGRREYGNRLKTGPITIKELTENEYISDEEKERLMELEKEIWSSEIIFKHNDTSEGINLETNNLLSIIAKTMENIENRRINAFEDKKRKETEKEAEKKAERLELKAKRSKDEFMRNAQMKVEEEFRTRELRAKARAGLVSLEDIRIEDMDLSGRSCHSLKRRFESLAELANLTYKELKQIRGLGKDSLEEVIIKLAEYGVEIKNRANTDKAIIYESLEDVQSSKESSMSIARERAIKDFEQLVTGKASIEDWGGLSTKTINALRKSGIITWGQLRKLTSEDLEKMEKIGIMGYDDITDQLEVLEVIRKFEAKNLGIEELGVSTKICNCLKKAGINSLRDLTKLTPEELEKIENLGKKSSLEIISKLAEYGITMGSKDELETDNDITYEVLEDVQETEIVDRADEEIAGSKSELEELKDEKMSLEVEDKAKEERKRRIKELLAEYYELTGERIIHTDDEDPDFKGE